VLQEFYVGHWMTIIQKIADATRQWGDIAKSVGIPKTIAERYGKRMESLTPRKLP
jgi:hypothetical protein